MVKKETRGLGIKTPNCTWYSVIKIKMVPK